jgi:hypothetical protein
MHSAMRIHTNDSSVISVNGMGPNGNLKDNWNRERNKAARFNRNVLLCPKLWLKLRLKSKSQKSVERRVKVWRHNCSSRRPVYCWYASRSTRFAAYKSNTRRCHCVTYLADLKFHHKNLHDPTLIKTSPFFYAARLIQDELPQDEIINYSLYSSSYIALPIRPTATQKLT